MQYIRALKTRYRKILSYTGVLLMGSSLVMFVSLVTIFFYSGEQSDLYALLLGGLITLVSGYLLKGRVKEENQAEITLKEGGIVVLFSWILITLFSALPFLISGQLNFTQAVFETTSGWTTTGLSVVDVTHTSHAFLLYRSLMQFFGGAGIAVVMLSAIIGTSGMGLYQAEGRNDRLLPHVARSTKMIMIIYSTYTIAGILLYKLAGMGWFDAVNHSMAALSTGGFSTKPDSIGAFNSLSIELITIVLMILGTINFATHYLLFKGQFKQFVKNGEVRFLFVLLSTTIPLAVYGALRGLYGALAPAFRIGIFELTSAISTTGFSTVGYRDWPAGPFLLMLLVMLIGGGTGSTAGGIKQYRIYLLLKQLWWQLRGMAKPDRVVEYHSVVRAEGKHRVTKEEIAETQLFVFFYMLLFALGVLVLSFYGYPLRDALFEYASALGTVGLSIGITAADAPAGVLWAQTIGMLLGRLEIMVIFYALIRLFKDGSHYLYHGSKRRQ